MLQSIAPLQFLFRTGMSLAGVQRRPLGQAWRDFGNKKVDLKIVLVTRFREQLTRLRYVLLYGRIAQGAAPTCVVIHSKSRFATELAWFRRGTTK